MAKKIHRIEEIDVGDGKIGHRQSVIEFDENGIICPIDRFPEEHEDAMIAEWNRVMDVLEDIDLDHIVDGISLMDHCKNVVLGRDPMVIGTNERCVKKSKEERKLERQQRNADKKAEAKAARKAAKAAERAAAKAAAKTEAEVVEESAPEA